jgi:hypothetical protein
MRVGWRTAAMVLLLALGAAAQGSSPSVQIPKEFAGYREWPRLLEKAKAVPLDLWLRCVAPSEADWRRAAKAYGPHNQRFIQVHANPLALPASRDAKLAFPTGSILVKEKSTGSEGKAPDGVAVMVKRDTPQFTATGGWEFLYFPSKDSRGVQASCAGCHRAAPLGRHVFAAYPPWEQ